VLVGDFDPDAAVRQIEKMVEGWKPSMPFQRIAQQANTKVAAEREVILTPEKENAVYNAGYLLAMKDDDPDYPALVLGNYIMGASGLNSRIFGHLRNEQGLSYGAGSHFGAHALDKYAQLTVNASCKPENIGKVRKGVQEAIDKLLKGGVTEAE